MITVAPAVFAIPTVASKFDLSFHFAEEEGAGLRVGLEGAYLPKVDPATATPTICRPGQGPLNTDLVFALPRPRIGLEDRYRRRAVLHSALTPPGLDH